MLFDGGSIPRAEALAKDILASQAGEPAALVLLGRAAAHRNAPDEAIGYLRDALMSDPHDVDVRVILGATYLEIGVSAQALSIMEDAAKLDPEEHADNPRKIFFHVPPLVVDRAIQRFQSAAKDEASRAGANAALALLYYQHGKTKLARPVLDRALHANRADPVGLLYAAQLALENGVLKTAEASFRELAAHPAYAAVAHLGLARVLFKRGSYAEAGLEYETAQRLDSMLPLAFTERTLAGIKAKDGKVAARTPLEAPNMIALRELLFELEY
jgi:predicted Zn-dependent protease